MARSWTAAAEADGTAGEEGAADEGAVLALGAAEAGLGAVEAAGVPAHPVRASADMSTKPPAAKRRRRGRPVVCRNDDSGDRSNTGGLLPTGAPSSARPPQRRIAALGRFDQA